MIYCVEDDESIREIEVYALKSTGFEAAGFSDGAAFFEAVQKQTPQLVLLDVMLPGEDGVAILKRLRAAPATKSVPVVMATARGAEYDKIASLDLGADDYLVKPFGFRELIARIRAVTRRTARSGEAEGTDGAVRTLDGGRVVLDERIRRVTVAGEEVPLTRKEFDLLAVLASDIGAIQTREHILDEVWDTNWYGPTKTLDVHIASLRKKLGDPALIETVRGVGFRLRTDP